MTKSQLLLNKYVTQVSITSNLTNKGKKKPHYTTNAPLHSQWHHGFTYRRPITSRHLIPSTDEINSISWTLKIATAQVDETSATVDDSPIRDYAHPEEYSIHRRRRTQWIKSQKYKRRFSQAKASRFLYVGYS